MGVSEESSVAVRQLESAIGLYLKRVCSTKDVADISKAWPACVGIISVCFQDHLIHSLTFLLVDSPLLIFTNISSLIHPPSLCTLHYTATVC